MEILILKTGSKLEEKVREKLPFPFKYIHHADEGSKGALLVYSNDYFNMDKELSLSNVAQWREMMILRSIVLRQNAYIGPVYDSQHANIFDFMERLEINSADHDLTILKDLDTPIIVDNPSYDLYMHFVANQIVQQIEKIVHGNYAFNTMLSLSKKDLVLKENKVVKQSSDHSFINDEHKILTKSNMKLNATSHRLMPGIDVEELRSAFTDYNFGILKHTYKDLNSRFIPMVAAVNKIDRHHNNDAYGRAYTYEGATRSAILESLERHHNAKNNHHRKNVYGSYHDLKKHSMNPEKLTLHTAKQYEDPQYKYNKYSDDLQVDWFWSWSFKDASYILIPEQFIFYYDHTEQKKNNRYVYDTSNGAALGSTQEEAVMHGIFETIERDNFLVSFYNQETLDMIDTNHPALHNLNLTKAYLKSLGYELYFFDITKELRVPAVWCIMVNTNADGKVKSYSAAGCHFNPVKAIEGAFFEVVSSVPIYETVFDTESKKERRDLIFHDTHQLTEFEDHVLYYSHHDSIKNFQWLFNNPIVKAIEDLYPEWYQEDTYKNVDLNHDLQNLIEKVLHYHEDIIFTDISSESLKEAGLCCVKVLIPGMQVVTFGMQNERIAAERLINQLRLSGKEMERSKLPLNKDPHPFP